MLDSLKNKQSLLPCLVKPDNVADGNCNKNTHDVSGTNFKGTKTTISSVAMATKKVSAFRNVQLQLELFFVLRNFKSVWF